MKSSIKNLSIVGILNLFNLGLGLLLFTSAASKLNTEEFGIYSLLTLLLVWFSKIIDFGSNSNYVSNFLSKGQNFLNELMNYKIISFIFTSITSYLVLHLIVSRAEISLISPIFIAGLFFYGINYLLFALFQKEEKFFKASLLNFVPALIKGIVGILVILNFIKLDLVGFFSIFALSIAGSSIFLVYQIKQISKFKLDLRISHYFKSFFLAGTSQQINESWGPISNFLTFLMRNLSDLGNYSFASKLSNVFSVISYSIYTVILTSNARRKKEDKNYNLFESIILGLILLIIAGAGTLVAPSLINHFFQGKFNESIVVFGILIFSGAFSSIHKFLDNYFFIEEKSVTLFKITSFKLVLFLTLSIIFINSFGIIGLALADLIVSILITVITFTYISLNLKRK